MSWQRLIPLVLVGVLGVAVAASAALGAAQSPTSPAAPSPEAQSKLFHVDVARTLTSKSFTFRFAGQTTVYQAPNRTEVVDASPGSFGVGMNMVTIGSTSYVHFGTGQWATMPFALPGSGSGSAALSYLQALSSFKTAHLDGDTYTVGGVLSDLPKALVTLIFTVVTHGPNNQTGASFTPPHPNEHAKFIGRVVVGDGRVTSETFTALEAYPSRGRDARSPTGTIAYSRFDSSPAIAAPTKADLNRPASPCGPTASGSCQVTTKGAAPHSALCKAIRAHGPNARAAEVIAQAQAAPKSRQWSKIRKAELELLTLEDSLAQAVERSQHSAPRNIQEAAQAEITYLHEEKLDLLKSKSFSQFNASSTTIVAKMIGAFESLAQYENKQCGGTTTYYSQGQGTLGQLSPLPVSE
jgi:hypothetical protein